MKVSIFIFVVASTFIYETHQCMPSVTTASGGAAPIWICSGQLIFEDHFDTLDHNKWKHEITLGGGGNWEFQWYTNDCENSIAQNGFLKIKPTLTSDFLGESALTSRTVGLSCSCTNSLFYGCERRGTVDNIINPIRSAKLYTKGTFAFKYGRVEVRAKMPSGDWLWPAIWMLPKHDIYGEWPRSGAIDIAASRGNRKLGLNGVNIGVQQMASTLHWGPRYDNNGFSRTHWEKNKDEFNEKFHVYELLWTPDSITFKVDDEFLGSVTPPPQGGFWELGEFGKGGKESIWEHGSKIAPFDHEFYLIISLAVGGVSKYFPDNASNPGGKPWKDSSAKAATDFWNGREQWLPTWNLGRNENASLQVDYVRVYAV
ncbi:hypothetical protein ILUMI_07407 [Ignelater luminosus]|uniref:GH16 domain-containing protein n=1 Tax=Ignelater luminosus TaxID=2038154 RepID=A0A8K0D6J8_IGNLU|nr:hypothetical protein ILUMI_07407 [Ignelater luminosus]